MDVSFNNVLEGTRQYFLGLPKQTAKTNRDNGGPGEEMAPGESGAPASSRPPSGAAAAPRPPSEPLEPEPHIIHKATVMREAAERRRERPDPEPDPDSELSPPTHVIRRPPPPSPAAAPAAPCPSPARPPSAAPSVPAPLPPAPPAPLRHSPHPHQTYARLSSSLPQQHTRLRDMPVQSSSNTRYVLPHNDRVPPIHHPQAPVPMPPRAMIDSRSAPIYAPLPHRHEQSHAYPRNGSHYERHAPVHSRKYDHQQTYPGYRPASVPLQRGEPPHKLQYKPAPAEASRFVSRPPDRAPPPPQPEISRLPLRVDYPTMNRIADGRATYQYATPSTSVARYPTNIQPTAVQNATPSLRMPYRPAAAAPKTSYEVAASSNVQTSPARSTAKPGYPSQQARMTVSVTSLVNQMNQTKQKRESPLDLSVKTVKNSADSSTMQDDTVDSVLIENKTIPLPQPRPVGPQPNLPYVASHKVDFAPDFAQYRERNSSQNYNAPVPTIPPPVRYNGAYDASRSVAEQYPVDNQQPQTYSDRSRFVVSTRNDLVPRIDLTRQGPESRIYENSKIRDDRHFIIEERKRPAGPIASNIPEKIKRHETWTSDSRIDRMNRSAREQHELMSRPVYSYSSHKRLESYQNDVKKAVSNSSYHEHHMHGSHRYPPYPAEPQTVRESSDYHNHYQERNPSVNSRHIIQKIPSHREVTQHYIDTHNGVPADKRVLSILRNSLETKHGFVEPTKPIKQIPDLIVIDDVDDSIIEITDLTKENEVNQTVKQLSNSTNQKYTMGQHIQMPKAVDSIARDNNYFTNDTSAKQSQTVEYDVASRIRTKAELKDLPPSQETTMRSEQKQDNIIGQDIIKVVPKSQKQHLFNQIREDLRLESVIKTEKHLEPVVPEIKSEPLNIEEIEKDAEITIKTENLLSDMNADLNAATSAPDNDLDWLNTCDNFMEQLKTGCSKKKHRRQCFDSDQLTSAEKFDNHEPKENVDDVNSKNDILPVVIKQEPLDEEEKSEQLEINTSEALESVKDDFSKEVADELQSQNSKKHIETYTNRLERNLETDEKNSEGKRSDKDIKRKPKTKIVDVRAKESTNKEKKKEKRKSKNIKPKCSRKCEVKVKTEKIETLGDDNSSSKEIVKEGTDKIDVLKTVIKEENESTDDDEPLIKSKLLKEKENERRLKYRILRDFTEKSAYVKLECFDVDLNKNTRISIDSISKDKEEKDKLNKPESNRKILRSKSKTVSNENVKIENSKTESSSDSEEDIASRLRQRKSMKQDENKSEEKKIPKTSGKLSPSKKPDGNASTASLAARKTGFGDGSDFHPGWEEELYRYKRSLRMPPRLIAIPRGQSGGPFIRGSGGLFSRGTTSLPDLDPAPLSPASSSAPSAATDDIYSRRPDKLVLDSDLESNSSCSITVNKLQYDSEASTSTVFSMSKKKGSSIVDILIQKCGKREDTKKKSKEKDDKTSKPIKKSNDVISSSEGVQKSRIDILDEKKEKLSNDIFYLGDFRKETVTAFRNDLIKNTDSLLSSEELMPASVKSRTRTESRVLKRKATMKEVFGDNRPASAPPDSCRDDEEAKPLVKAKKEHDSNIKVKHKKIADDKLKRRSSSIRDGLRSTKSLKMNDAKGRMMRLKKRNNLIKTLANKRLKDLNIEQRSKHRKMKSPVIENCKDVSTEVGSSVGPVEGHTKKRLRRLFGRRKFSSGFDYIRKKKKVIRRKDDTQKVRRTAPKPSPESVHDIQKEIKGWFINKSIGETHLHRAARLGYTDCVAYCLEKLEFDPSAKDNAGFTPLHVAAAKGYVRIARLLLQYGANVSAAAQGGIRPLHEASESCHVEVIRLLLSYGADPLLGTYAGQTPAELAEGAASLLIRRHIADVQGLAVEPWIFPHPFQTIDMEELGCDPLASPPPAPLAAAESTLELQVSEAPLPPFYSLKPEPGKPPDGLWCLLQDVTNLLQIKSKESLLKQIHCGSGSPKELVREIRTSEFLERAQCTQLLCAGERLNVRASRVSLVRLTDKLRQLLKVEVELVT